MVRFCVRCRQEAEHGRRGCKQCKALDTAMLRHGVDAPDAAFDRVDRSEVSKARRYGMLVSDIDRMRVEQEGRCWICRKADDLVIDHDHVTGVVRGLLCRLCNTGLGMFKDNPASLARAIEYLTE